MVILLGVVSDEILVSQVKESETNSMSAFPASAFPAPATGKFLDLDY